MPHSWTRVIHYSRTGWQNCSTPFFFLLLFIIIIISIFGSAPFWITISSLLPVLLLYFPVVGFMVDILERDWEDWHLW
jgi:hypothetical protein